MKICSFCWCLGFWTLEYSSCISYVIGHWSLEQTCLFKTSGIGKLKMVASFVLWDWLVWSDWFVFSHSMMFGVIWISVHWSLLGSLLAKSVLSEPGMCTFITHMSTFIPCLCDWTFVVVHWPQYVRSYFGKWRVYSKPCLYIEPWKTNKIRKMYFCVLVSLRSVSSTFHFRDSSTLPLSLHQ